MFTAYRGYLHVIRVLLQWGADISAKTEHGHTALHLVVYGKHLAVTKALIKAGADIEAVINFFKEEGVSGTPLHVAASKGFCIGMMVLINAGAKINSYNRFRYPPVDGRYGLPCVYSTKTKHTKHTKHYNYRSGCRRIAREFSPLYSCYLRRLPWHPVEVPHLVRRVSVPPHKLSMQVPQSPIHNATLAVVAECPSASASARTGYGSAGGSIGGRLRKRKRGNFQNGCVQKHISSRTARFVSGIRERGAMPDCFRIHKLPITTFCLVSGHGERSQIFQDTQYTSTSFWPCIRARGACRTTSGHKIMPPGHFSTH